MNFPTVTKTEEKIGQKKTRRKELKKSIKDARISKIRSAEYRNTDSRVSDMSSAEY
jgi:hypothetical protein